ncbi:AF4/FMR2 family member lilli isoform X2 [Lucilia sericata]|uniref:AF4/FMR2 family member lilli isoform X2 n=1 Tax=Lucilia sericata TaxID=13632 RepID=UPI0018A85BEC|nr:AF4/FMR2 family member lilli isoform X2 [Lucilia sericata]
MDMKKISKPRMDDYEYERKQRREREKSERQQVQTSSSNREVALFSEPRRVNPSEDDDKISAKLGDYSKARDFINLYTVGISNSGHRHMPANAVLPGIVPTSSPLPNVSSGVATSASSTGSSSSSSSQRLLPPPPPQTQQQSQQPPHHYQQQQQQLRQTPYVKQADNKPPYNGRGGYPGQPVNRLSSGMAPPKGPPSGSLLPPATTHMPNGRQSSSSASSVEKSYLGPPTASSNSSSATHNGRFSQPSIPKQRQKPLPPENDIKEIINHVTNTFCPPKMLTGIDATPHNTLMENYNLSEKNKHKYSFDILAKTSIVEPLDSPPRKQMPAPRFVPPLSATSTTQMPSSKSVPSSAPTSSSSTYIAPATNTTAPVGHLTSSTSSSSGQSSSLISNATITSPTVPHSPILSRPSKESMIKPLKTEKPTPPPIEKQNSTLENDLELSDSDDDRKKQNRSTVNSSDSSPSDSSESGSDSSRSEPQQPATIPAPHQLISQQQQMTVVLPTKKKLGSGSAGTIPGSASSCSSGLGSSAPPSGGSSSSSSNKTPSPSNTTKWQLSRYFNKAPLHQTPTQDVVSPSTTSIVNSVNSMNVANLNMPITLRGGAQIIPEPPQHVANIKNESMLEDVDDDEDDGNEMEDENLHRRNRGTNKGETFPHPAFPSRKAPAGLSVTPLSPMLSDIKKEISTPHGSMGVNQQQVPILNASEFVSIPSSHIKHESMSIAGGHTTITSYSRDVIEGLSNLSSDTNTSDDERLPVRGPTGTLQIPGVPAAITALPRSPPMVQKTQMLNSVTMIRLDPINSSPTAHLSRPPPPQSRAKKPRKKLKQQTSATVATDTSDEEQDDVTKRLVSPAASGTTSGITSGVVAGPKKGRGRPRKTTPNQSGNISSASSASASAKGPTLTAKKDINKKPASTTATATARRRASRLNSSNSSAQDLNSTTPTKQAIVQAPIELIQTTQVTTPVSVKEQVHTANATSDDSSSSSESSTCSMSKSSSSISDSDVEETTNKQPIITNTSSSEDEGTKPNGSAKSKTSGSGEHKSAPPKRIVKKLNTRKSSLEDLSAPLTASTKPHDMSMSSSSSSSSSESSAEDFSHLPNASTLTGGSSQQPATSIGAGSSSQRSANHQSPHKVASAFFSESSGEERSDSDSGEPRKEKKLKRDKPKSDKNKISTLTRIFKSSNEGGAKKQGQVLIVDQSEDQQQQQMHQQQKHISPALRLSQENLSAVHNSLQNTPTAQSPRLTPGGHMRSPRSLNMTPLASQVLAAGAMASHRTPDRSTTSAERKLQQRIKTPTRTPTRTPPTTRTPTPTPAVAATLHHPNPSPSPSSTTPSHLHQQHLALLQPPPPTSLICKIDLSRLLNVPEEWQTNAYRLYGHAPGHQQNHLTPSAGRTPIYDHETILNADLQSCNNQMRLKSASSGNISGGGSGSATPRSTGNRTPIQIASTISSASERELSHSRENLHDLAKENCNSGRMSSRSTDGSICGGGSTPKEHLLPPNGYNSAAAMIRGYNSPNPTLGGVKLLTGVKHEQIIKHEPDSEYSCNETKFKSDSSTDPSLIKQELLILKQDYKPSDLSEKSSLCSPNDLPMEPKPRRKRSTSSSSSPYKEKKRKKEKDLNAIALTEKEKMVVSGSDIVKEKEIANDSLKSGKEPTVTEDCLTNTNGQQQTQDQQFSHTNHDRLLMENKFQQQQSTDKSNSLNNNNSNKTTNNVSNTASPAHLQTTNNHSTTIASTNMPPPANVGLIPTVTQPPQPAAACLKNVQVSAPATSMPSVASSSSSPAAIAGVSNSSVPPTEAVSAAASTTQPQVIYRSYFERDDDALSDEFRFVAESFIDYSNSSTYSSNNNNTTNSSVTAKFQNLLQIKDGKFLQEAVHRKHAADREQNTFNQVTLYLEAVVYFLLSGAAMEQHSRSEDAAWTMYKDTLSLIKFISSKFRHLQVSSANQHDTHNKVAILSLRCQSLISLKLFKLKRNFCRQINNICSDFFKSGKGDIINGNTPSSISPSNSVGSQGSGSNTPPGKIVPQDIHSALCQQNQYFTYLSSSHELWDQADRLVRQGNHTDFFIALDHENGPLTLHSNVYEVFRYVQAGLKKLKDEMLIQ